MTLYLDAAGVRSTVTVRSALTAARRAVEAEAAGTLVLPSRIDLPSGAGFLRVMPAVLGERMGLKIMTLVRGVGTRYLVALLDVATGELLALVDAGELTRLRTAACTAVAAQLIVDEPPTELGLIGSGFEAAGHLRALADIWPLTRVRVFSPSPARRAAFAARYSAELGLDVCAVDRVEDVTADQAVVVLATKAGTPVLDGRTLRSGAVVLSIGSTRPDLRELDTATLRRAGTVVADDVTQVQTESGDVIVGIAEGALDPERVVSLGRVLADRQILDREPDRDLLVFKSVGTAAQDLALADVAYRAALTRGGGRDLGELATLKPFAGSPVPAGTS